MLWDATVEHDGKLHAIGASFGLRDVQLLQFNFCEHWKHMKAISLSVVSLLFVVRFSATPPSSLVYANGSTIVSKVSEKNVPIKTITCVWPPNSGFGPGTVEEEDNRVRLALYEAVVHRVGVVKAKMICATIEGDPVPVYATAKGGKIKVTYDYSKDRHFRFNGWLKLFGGNSYTTRQVEIGYLDKGNFVPLRQAPVSSGQRLILRLKKTEYF
jgi:hypothetical protein